MSDNSYRDNYPYNIEAPQRVYVQYSQDITFDYSNGQYPLGEEHEGFVWENVYTPVPHTVGDLDLERHVWMRWRIGERNAWTVPMRFTDAYSNIEVTELEEVVGTNQVRFRLKYTLDSGEIIYSEYITLTNGIDGRGIISSDIRDNNLYLTYTDGIEEEVGRVVGYDGNGFPSFGSDISGNIIRVDGSGNPIWIPFLTALNDNLSATLPIVYTTGVLTHSNNDGYRHIPTGGSSGNLLQTDGSGNYSWFDITNLNLSDYIPWTALDDLAGIGDTDKLYSADKILSLVNAASVGIKYSVSLYSDLASIPTPLTGEMAVVTADPLYPNRPVYRYNGVIWESFFDLDADHNHDDRYFTESELSTSGAGGQVHWNNVTNKPTFFEDFNISGDSGSGTITDGETLGFIGGTGITTSVLGNNITINASASLYTEGGGIDIVGNVISHEDTSTVTNTANLNGVVLQNMTFDTFGHVLAKSSINLDTRYSLTAHTHANLTPGIGLSGSVYNGSTAQTWNINYVGSGGYLGTSNSPARVNHYHPESEIISSINYTLYPPTTGRTSYSYAKGIELNNVRVVNIQYAAGNTSAAWTIPYNALLGTIVDSDLWPDDTIYQTANCMSPGGTPNAMRIKITTSGQIYYIHPITVTTEVYIAGNQSLFQFNVTYLKFI